MGIAPCPALRQFNIKIYQLLFDITLSHILLVPENARAFLLTQKKTKFNIKISEVSFDVKISPLLLVPENAGAIHKPPN